MVISSDLDKMKRDLRKYKKQIPFATAKALTATAKKGQKLAELKAKKELDRPTKRTQKAFFVQPATKKRQWSRVYLKDHYFKGTAPSNYLTVIEGGVRPRKRSEMRLQERGFIRRNQWIIPAYIRLNQFGNVTGAMMNKILSGLGAQHDNYQNSRRGQGLAKKYFIVNSALGVRPRSEHLSDGIYERRARGVKLLFHITDQAPRISKMFDFHRHIRKATQAHLNREMDKAVKYAIRTAK